ncbi:MAG: hypothetical protein IJO22_03480 [Oscillospiraceae bacterium]|nr:hypothetical protein [Oscillospiraceae bacterium]
MCLKEIDPFYKVIFKNKMYGIFGKEKSSGETVLIEGISPEEKTVYKIVGILNKNKVSVFHAKEVVRDLVNDFLYK